MEIIQLLAAVLTIFFIVGFFSCWWHLGQINADVHAIKEHLLTSGRAAEPPPGSHIIT